MRLLRQYLPVGLVGYVLTVYMTFTLAAGKSSTEGASNHLISLFLAVALVDLTAQVCCSKRHSFDQTRRQRGNSGGQWFLLVRLSGCLVFVVLVGGGGVTVEESWDLEAMTCLQH